jgi:hypothetical protein
MKRKDQLRTMVWTEVVFLGQRSAKRRMGERAMRRFEGSRFRSS